MKTILTNLLFITLFSFSSLAQIPNSSFESWTNSVPDDWTTNSLPPTLLPVSQTTDAHSGTYAVKGQVVNYMGNIIAPIIFPVATVNDGFPISQSYLNLSGWYKASMIASDALSIQISLTDASNSIVAFGFAYLLSNVSFEEFNTPMSYISANPPVAAKITIAIIDSSTSTGHVGSNFIVDDLTFSMTSKINKVDFPVFSISPNPVKNKIFINGQFNTGSKIYFSILNQSGQLVLRKNYSDLSDENAIDLNELSNGNYFLIINDGNSSVAKKFIISK